MYELLIKNGTLVKGDKSKSFQADIAIKDDKIVAIEPGLTTNANYVIEARGKIVCPGFIDMHSHSDITLIADNLAQSKIRQGVTTEVIGNCGLTPFPLVDRYKQERRKTLNFIDASTDWDWYSAKDYLNKLEGAPPSVNVVALVGHGSVRTAVMGFAKRKANPEEIKEMQNLLAECFRAGIWGISTGLSYPPDCYSDEAELQALAEVAANHKRIFSFHIRGERLTLFKAIKEVIKVGLETGVNVEISHLKCCGKSNWGRMEELLGIIDQASNEGLNINFDVYPYTAGSTYLGLLFPAWAHEGGMEALIQRLKDKYSREKICDEIVHGTKDWESPVAEFSGENIIISSVASQKNKFLEGKSVKTIAHLWGVSPVDTVCELMLAERGKVEMIIFQLQVEDIYRAIMHGKVLIGSDGLSIEPSGKISKGLPHPRSYGTYPMVIREYVYEKGLLTLEDAIYKMSYGVARKIGLHTRGLLAPGYFADIVVFDPKSITDRATYEKPHQFPEGINYVIVNGKIAVNEKGHTDTRSGKVLIY